MRYRYAAAGLALCLIVQRNAARGAGESTTQPGGDGLLEKCWTDLAEPDPAGARALLGFAAKPGPAVAFIAAHLQPLAISQTDLDASIAALTSKDDAVWKPAFEHLSYFDPRLTTPLKKLMAAAKDPLQRSRLVAVLTNAPADRFVGRKIDLMNVDAEECNFVVDGSDTIWAETKVSQLGSRYMPKKNWARAVRAIVLLQSIGTPEAVAVLKTMATGHAEAQPTKVAVEALHAVRKD